MVEHIAIAGIFSNSKSRYYMDPKIKNGECTVVKPADPEKLKALYKLRTSKKRPS